MKMFSLERRMHTFVPRSAAYNIERLQPILQKVYNSAGINFNSILLLHLLTFELLFFCFYAFSDEGQ